MSEPAHTDMTTEERLRALLGARASRPHGAHTEMKTEERLRVCHRHAELRYLSGGRSGNAALCDRLGMDRRNATRIPGVIRHRPGAPCRLRRRNAARVSGVIRQARRNGFRPSGSTRPTRSGYAPFRA